MKERSDFVKEQLSEDEYERGMWLIKHLVRTSSIVQAGGVDARILNTILAKAEKLNELEAKSKEAADMEKHDMEVKLSVYERIHPGHMEGSNRKIREKDK